MLLAEEKATARQHDARRTPSRLLWFRSGTISAFDWLSIPLEASAQKSSQKSTRPRGAKDVVTFPGAIGRNNACVRADARQVAVGGSRRLLHVGECIVADGGPPCQRQPLRGQRLPIRGGGPSTWFPSLLSGWLNVSAKAIKQAAGPVLCGKGHDDLPRGPHPFVVGRQNTGHRHSRSRVISSRADAARQHFLAVS